MSAAAGRGVRAPALAPPTRSSTRSAEGLLAPQKPVVVLLSGGRDSTCLLDLAVRIAGPRAVSALHVNYGLRDAADADERALRARLRAARRPARRSHRPGRPETGNLQAWARDERYGAAARARAGARRRRRRRAHRHRPGRDDPLPARRPRPAGARCSACARATGSLVRPLLAIHARARPRRTARERGLRGARTRPTSSTPTRARGSARELVPALSEIHPAAEENVLALAAVLRDEAAVLDALVDDVARREPREIALDAAARAAAGAAAAGRPAARRRGGRTTGAGTARRAPEIAGARPATARRRSTSRDGVRAIAERGILRFERRPGRTARADARQS